MTFLQKHHENKKLINSYMAFLEECTGFESRLRLITEIGRLHEQNKAIEKMTYQDTKQDIHDYTITVNALL